MPLLLQTFVHKVLNSSLTILLAHRYLSMEQLLWHIGRLDYNCLIIGKYYCWLVNARTCHPNHFLGTERKIALTSKAAS